MPLHANCLPIDEAKSERANASIPRTRRAGGGAPSLSLDVDLLFATHTHSFMLSLNGPTLQLSTPSEPVNDKTAHSYSMAVPVIHYTTHNTTASASLSASRALNLTHVILLCKVCHRQRRRHLHPS